MLTIWKYQLLIEDVQSVSMPKGAKILSVDTQYELPYVWVLVNPNAELVSVPVHTIGTGNPANVQGLRFLGTYQLLAGKFVGHVFVPMTN